MPFAINKQGLKALDRLGTGASHGFHNVTGAEILRYVEFDLHDNVVFTLGPLLMAQGHKGVPIGGFLSAQLAEIWALWREAHYAFGDKRASVCAAWVRDMQGCLPALAQANACSLTLSNTADFSLSGATDTCLPCGDGLLMSPNIRTVTLDSINSEGFTGWWNPVDRLWGSMQLPGVSVMLVHTTAWDGSPGGRVDTIMRNTHRANKGRVRDFFGCYDVLRGVSAEVQRGLCSAEHVDGLSSEPMVLFGRYRDNIYLSYMNIASEHEPMVDKAISVLLGTLYGINLKWEPHTNMVTWGEGRLGILPSGEVLLLRKGCTLSLQAPPMDMEWSRWTDSCSPHAAMVWRSHFPALLGKCLWYSLSHSALVANVRSLLWGVGYRRYPGGWWKGRLRRFLTRYRLATALPWGLLMQWVREGRAQAAM